MYQKELASIRRFGLVTPLIVRLISPPTPPPRTGLRRGKGSSSLPTAVYELIDGEHRLRAAKELGYTEVPIWNLGDIPDAVAKQLTIVLNETRGSSDPGKLGELLMDLLETELPADLLEVLPFPEERFAELTKFAEFDWNALVEPKKEATGWVERTYRMPKESAAVIDEAISRVKDDSGSVKDWHALEWICAEFLAK